MCEFDQPLSDISEWFNDDMPISMNPWIKKRPSMHGRQL
ncbi:hypothetical protein BCAR13_710157 [Paraburkholderia caribensis]|jgi:hypothetical protein|nr:hypothetical protein BCAR13_710157 [Paraburkholderia caribensis]